MIETAGFHSKKGCGAYSRNILRIILLIFVIVAIIFSLVLFFCASAAPVFIGLIFFGNIELIKPIDAAIIGYALYYALVAFAEELLFRGYIRKVLEGKSKILIYTVSAFAFAGFHFISPEFNLMTFVLIFIFSIIFMHMYVSVENIWPLIMFHFGWNLFGEYISLYKEYRGHGIGTELMRRMLEHLKKVMLGCYQEQSGFYKDH